MFFQWVVCSAVMCSGIVVQLIRNSKFYPIVILGGVIWETGMCLFHLQMQRRVKGLLSMRNIYQDYLYSG